MINTRKNSENDLFPLTLPNTGCQRATGNGKSYRNYLRSYGKAIEKLSVDLVGPTRLQSQQILMVTYTIQRNEWPSYPALRTTKEVDNVDFSFLRRQLFTSDQAEALEREILLRSVRSEQNVFLRHESLSRIKRKKETLNVLLLLENTRICNVRRTSKQFRRLKLTFQRLKLFSLL